MILIRGHWRPILVLAVASAVLVFVGLAVRDALRLGTDLSGARWGFVAGAIALEVLALLALPLLWTRILATTGRDQDGSLPIPELFLAYSRSWLARYVPGRLLSIGGRVILARRHGVSAVSVSNSMLLEAMFSYGTFGALGVGLGLWFVAAPAVGLLVGVLLLAALAGVVPWVQRSASALAQRVGDVPVLSKLIRGFPEGSKPMAYRQALQAVALYAIHSGVQVLGFLLLAIGLLGSTNGDLAGLSSAWMLGGLVGFIAFFVPVGFGVREGATFVLLVRVVGAPEAGVLVAASRIMLIAADVVFVLLAEAGLLAARLLPLHRASVGGQTRSGGY